MLWGQLIYELRRRGSGQRETGAFLLGRQRPGAARVTTYLCYDDLDSQALESGAITFHAVGYAALWKYCRTKGLRVIADVHTHPGGDVGQSHIDQRHPMVPVAGHTAIIVPHFGRAPWWSLKTVGMYEYLGNFKWRAHRAADKTRRVHLSAW